MNERDASGAAAPKNLTGASDRPPDYSTCITNPAAVGWTGSSSGQMYTRNPPYPMESDRITVNPMSEHNAAETFPLKGIHHHDAVNGRLSRDTTSSAPFLDLATDSENRNDGYNPRSDQCYPQPAFNPSYTANRPITPRPNVYGRKTIVLQRTDAEISARNRKIWISLCLGLLIGTVVCGIILAICFTIPLKRTRWEDRVKDKTVYDYESHAYDRKISEILHDPATDSYPTDTRENPVDEEPRKPSEGKTFQYPSWGDLSEPKLQDKADNDEDAALRALGIDPDRYKDIIDLQRKLSESSGDIGRENPVDEEPRKPSEGKTFQYPNWDDLSEPKLQDKADNDEDAALRALGIDPDQYKDIFDLQKKLSDSSGDIGREMSIFGSRTKDTMGTPRLQSTNDYVTKQPPQSRN